MVRIVGYGEGHVQVSGFGSFLVAHSHPMKIPDGAFGCLIRPLNATANAHGRKTAVAKQRLDAKRSLQSWPLSLIRVFWCTDSTIVSRKADRHPSNDHLDVHASRTQGRRKIQNEPDTTVRE
jgi:hypothetical protein